MNELTTFRKKPVEVQAIQWDGTIDGATAIIDWILSKGGTARYNEERSWDTSADETGRVVRIPRATPLAAHIAVDTPDATGRVYVHDWAIRGAAGEFYPCRGDIFDATYDEVTA